MRHSYAIALLLVGLTLTAPAFGYAIRVEDTFPCSSSPPTFDERGTCWNGLNVVNASSVSVTGLNVDGYTSAQIASNGLMTLSGAGGLTYSINALPDDVRGSNTTGIGWQTGQDTSGNELFRVWFAFDPTSLINTIDTEAFNEIYNYETQTLGLDTATASQDANDFESSLLTTNTFSSNYVVLDPSSLSNSPDYQVKALFDPGNYINGLPTVLQYDVQSGGAFTLLGLNDSNGSYSCTGPCSQTPTVSQGNGGDPTSVPEPSSLAILGLGLVALRRSARFRH